ncbi:hypothetical protein HN309_18670, partial [Acinetobacter baumannii]|uniref:hypothetical protein n=1 Tax=Acinetobacter baumannii TaxID=470 RepID=UPI0018991FEA
MVRNVLARNCLLCGALVHADTTVMPQPGRDSVAVGRYMEVLVDAGAQWTFEQVRGEFAGRFQPND